MEEIKRKKQIYIDVLSKIFETERHLLRTYCDEDYSDVGNLFRSSKVMGAFGGKACENDKDVKKVIDSENSKTVNQTHFGYVIETKEARNVIGLIGVKFKYIENNVIEIYYMLNDKYWNKGIMSECVAKFVDKIYGIDPEIRIQGQFRYDNIGSKKVLENCGFKYLQTDEINNEEYLRYEHKRQ